jgi:hypothetical protein
MSQKFEGGTSASCLECVRLCSTNLSARVVSFSWLYGSPEKTDYAEFIRWTQRGVPLNGRENASLGGKSRHNQEVGMLTIMPLAA